MTTVLALPLPMAVSFRRGRTPTRISRAKQKVSRDSGARRTAMKIVTATAYQTSLPIAIVAAAAFVPKGDPDNLRQIKGKFSVTDG